jgi:hypothetical protein
MVRGRLADRDAVLDELRLRVQQAAQVKPRPPVPRLFDDAERDRDDALVGIDERVRPGKQAGPVDRGQPEQVLWRNGVRGHDAASRSYW